MVLREKVSDLITTPPNTPCLSPEHEVVSTLKAKITITKGFFDNFLTKKAKIPDHVNYFPLRYTLLGIFPQHESTFYQLFYWTKFSTQTMST